jgi:hypothetical protein
MKSKEEYLTELLVILSAGLVSIFFTTFMAWIGFRIYESFEGRLAKKISDDVKKTSQESWDSDDS